MERGKVERKKGGKEEMRKGGKEWKEERRKG